MKPVEIVPACHEKPVGVVPARIRVKWRFDLNPGLCRPVEQVWRFKQAERLLSTGRCFAENMFLPHNVHKRLFGDNILSLGCIHR